MNNLTSFQRKLIYAGGIVILLLPILALGQPASRTAKGGRLAQLRQQYDLGETSLGNVDPSSSTMNLVLLGFRGVATNLLWRNALEQRDQKQWAQLRATTDSIILLQPHYIKVWDFQGWNLAYNVSAEWDLVPDRYYWVKEGGKFYMRGVDRNVRNPDLVFKTAYVLGQKVGRADEWNYFRRYFNDDPDAKKFGGKPDPEFNRGYAEGSFQDNYMAARDWYLESTRREDKFPPQHIMMRELFRSYPAHQFMEMGNALHREGRFGDQTLRAWTEGFDSWTKEFGREEFPSEHGPIHLEITSAKELEDIAKANSKLLNRTVTVEELQRYLEFLQNTTNYPYWRTRSLAEAKPNTVEAHREIYDGQQLFKAGELEQSREKLTSGMKKLETLFADFPGFESDDLALEEALMAHIYLRAIYNLNGETVPTDLPLQRIWEREQGGPNIDSLQRQFRTQTQVTPNAK